MANAAIDNIKMVNLKSFVPSSKLIFGSPEAHLDTLAFSFLSLSQFHLYSLIAERPSLVER